jgi:hypothetical protein
LARNRIITGRLDCSSVYLELLSRDFGQGLVEILDEDEHAFCAGYFGNRAIRSWRERIDMLVSVGFIRTSPRGNRRVGYVLLVSHSLIVERLREEKKIDDAWWQVYQHRAEAVKGTPSVSDLPAS